MLLGPGVPIQPLPLKYDVQQHMSQYYCPPFSTANAWDSTPDQFNVEFGLPHTNISHEGPGSATQAVEDYGWSDYPGNWGQPTYYFPNTQAVPVPASETSEPGLLYAEDFTALEMQLSMVYYGHFPQPRYSQETAISPASSGSQEHVAPVPANGTLDWTPMVYQPNATGFGGHISQHCDFTSSASNFHVSKTPTSDVTATSYGGFGPVIEPENDYEPRLHQVTRLEPSFTSVASHTRDSNPEKSAPQWPGYEHAAAHPANYAVICPMPVSGSGRECKQMVPMDEYMDHLGSYHVRGSLQAVNVDASIWTCPLETKKGGLCDRTVVVGGIKSFTARHELRMIMEHILSKAHSFLIKSVPISWGPRGDWVAELPVRRAGPLPQIVCSTYQARAL
ncbi:hypothetical protein MD484_g6475, partial [Candolleomyces efflorescens]